MRTIDADALVKKFAHPPELIYTNVVVDEIRSAPTVGGWISVKDRLPETNDEVLTTYIVNGDKTKRFVESASYCDDTDGEGFWTSPWDEYIVPGTRQEVIAWMPMPKPYKPPKDGDDDD